jgi:hypothetical protein
VAAPAEAQTTYSTASGYVQVTVPGLSLGAISATLQNKSEHTSNATVNNDWVPLDTKGTPNPLDDVPAHQTLTVNGAGWTPDQWISEGYLCYIVDSNGGEEAFLIVDNTADTITVQCEFNLLDVARDIPNTTSISIRLAQTVGGLLGAGAGNTDFTATDRVYLWSGTAWTTYFVDINFNWRKSGGGFATYNDDVVFPDEGFFIQRNNANDITFTFFGDVPGKAQVTTMPGPGLQFVSSRYPVGTTIGQLGFETLPNWLRGPNGDFVYIWTGVKWDTYFFDQNGLGWRKQGGGFGLFDNDPVPPDSGVFVSRKGVSGPAQSANRHELPYTP